MLKKAKVYGLGRQAAPASSADHSAPTIADGEGNDVSERVMRMHIRDILTTLISNRELGYADRFLRPGVQALFLNPGRERHPHILDVVYGEVERFKYEHAGHEERLAACDHVVGLLEDAYSLARVESHEASEQGSCLNDGPRDQPSGGPNRSDTGEMVVIGICGESGSGKTTLARLLSAILRDECNVLHHDNYYRDFSHMSLEEVRSLNFDHPSALDSDLLVEHVDRLKDGLSVRVPRYSFRTGRREGYGDEVRPRRFLIIEGILVFRDERLRERMDLKVFLKTPSELCVLRRIQRDVQERGRTLKDVAQQYMETVRPMAQELVLPSAEWADVTLDDGGYNALATERILDELSNLGAASLFRPGESLWGGQVGPTTL